MVRKDKNPTASLLFGAAAVQCMVGLFGWSLYSINFGWIDWAITFSFLVYVVFGVWARWTPVTPAILGFLSYAVFLAIQGRQSIELLKSGWIFKLPMVVLLTIALMCALTSCRKRPSTTTEQQSAETHH
jgi:hypothetical protein